MAVPTFAQVLAQTNPNGVGLGPVNVSGGGLAAQQLPGLSFQTAGGPTPAGGGAAAGGGAPTLSPAEVAAAQAKTQAHNDFMSGQSNATNLINTGIGSAAQGYSGSILDYLSTLKQQQNTINSERTQNQLSKMQGTAGVNQMVSHGLQSGGVMLANKNAASSSAPDALARAYSVLGREQLSGVGNQFALAELKPNTEQTNLDQANLDEVRHAQLDKTNAINGIVNDASQKLTALNMMAMYASIPDRINIDQQIQGIRQQALDALTAYDSSLSSGIAANAPSTLEQNISSAAALRQAGTAPENSFQYTSTQPAQFQNTGPVPSELPIYTTPKKQY